MKRKTAAEYCDLSESAFVREVLAGKLPSGVNLGQREHWDRLALDAAITRLSGGEAIPPHKRRFMERHDEAA
jgi:hypothetical protein